MTEQILTITGIQFEQNGRIVAQGTPDDIRRDPDSLTGRFL